MKRVLITPLDWGLGHATRCIPIIQKLIERNWEVVIAGSGSSLQLLRGEFTSTPFYEITGYRPWYGKRSMTLSMILQFFKFIRVINKEHNQINELVQEHQIDLVISDNRYGAWTKLVPSIFITHQLMIPPLRGMSWLTSIVNYFNHRQIKKFSHCWIPDELNSKYSGVLSINQYTIPHANYIGIQSRFKPKQVTHFKYKVAVLISGPEPQRSEFENIVFNQLSKLNIDAVVVRGIVDEEKEIPQGSFNVFNHLNANELNQLLAESEIVVCRSGYSTIMDLVVLEKKAILVPTPGQPEQEYLAEYYMKMNVAPSYPQSTFDLQIALKEIKPFSGFKSEGNSNDLLDKVLDNLQS